MILNWGLKPASIPPNLKFCILPCPGWYHWLYSEPDIHIQMFKWLLTCWQLMQASSRSHWAVLCGRLSNSCHARRLTSHWGEHVSQRNTGRSSSRLFEDILRITIYINIVILLFKHWMFPRIESKQPCLLWWVMKLIKLFKQRNKQGQAENQFCVAHYHTGQTEPAPLLTTHKKMMGAGLNVFDFAW